MSRYRATGADLPFSDPLPAHGVSMEGYFWRLTCPATSRVIIALVGVNTPSDGAGSWATVGIATEPEEVLATSEVAGAWADPVRFGVQVGTSQPGRDYVVADTEHVSFAVGDCGLDIDVTDHRPWPRRRFGGSSYFQVVPGLNQYWHPWLLGGRAHGTARINGEVIRIDGWQVYAEKNWGRGGFPAGWWWGQAQGFAEPETCVAFAGGIVTAGPSIGGRQAAVEVTGLVVALSDGPVLRLGNPVTSPVRAETSKGHWRLSGRSARWQVEIAATDGEQAGFVLPVPLVDDRRNAPGALEHLAGQLRLAVFERGRPRYRGESQLAGLELGGRDMCEAELAARGGDPRPIR